MRGGLTYVPRPRVEIFAVRLVDPVIVPCFIASSPYARARAPCPLRRVRCGRSVKRPRTHSKSAQFGPCRPSDCVLGAVQNHLIACAQTRGSTFFGSEVGVSLSSGVAMSSRSRKLPSRPSDTPTPAPVIERLLLEAVGSADGGFLSVRTCPWSTKVERVRSPPKTWSFGTR